jgi:sugar/nucleoside kinase (ribokinase family)
VAGEGVAGGHAAQGSVAVLGNLAIDRIDGGPPRLGGCPVFAADALARLGSAGLLLTRCHAAERRLVDPWVGTLTVPVTLLAAEATSAFSLRYRGDTRSVTIDAVGERWSRDEVEGAAGCSWAHVAPLLRGDFPPATLRVLAAGGASVSFDGQGLVRRRRLGPLVLDRRFDRRLLATVSALKLADDEAQVVAGGRFHEGVADDLGVTEILVTRGSRGVLVFEPGRVTEVFAAAIHGVEATGAGDLFMTAYCCARSTGASPVEAARVGVDLVAAVLAERRREADEADVL